MKALISLLNWLWFMIVTVVIQFSYFSITQFVIILARKYLSVVCVCHLKFEGNFPSNLQLWGRASWGRY